MGGSGTGDDDEAGDVDGSGDAGAFGGDEVIGFGGGGEADGVEEDVGKLQEGGGDLAEAGLPGGGIDGERRRGREDGGGAVGVVGLGAEVSGDVLFLARTCCSVLTLR